MARWRFFEWSVLIFGVFIVMLMVGVGVISGLTVLNVVIGDDECNPDEEISRAPSPDGKVEALVMRGRCDWTFPYDYTVYLVPKGANEGEYLFVVENPDHGVNVRWLADGQLFIDYSKAHIQDVSSVSYHSVDGIPQLYEVKVVEGKVEGS